MPRPLAPTFRAFAIAVLVALPFALVGACTAETGVTPSCVPDVDSNGINTHVDGGCTGFATCVSDAGVPMDPAVCCKAYMGNELALCLTEFGVSGPTTGASTTGGGSGGAGGH
jgi:hypothetical protein